MLKNIVFSLLLSIVPFSLLCTGEDSGESLRKKLNYQVWYDPMQDLDIAREKLCRGGKEGILEVSLSKQGLVRSFFRTGKKETIQVAIDFDHYLLKKVRDSRCKRLGIANTYETD